MLHQLLLKIYGVLFHTLKCISHTVFPSFAIEKFSPHYAIFPFRYNFSLFPFKCNFSLLDEIAWQEKTVTSINFFNEEYLRPIVLLGHKPKLGYSH